MIYTYESMALLLHLLVLIFRWVCVCVGICTYTYICIHIEIERERAVALFMQIWFVLRVPGLERLNQAVISQHSILPANCPMISCKDEMLRLSSRMDRLLLLLTTLPALSIFKT